MMTLIALTALLALIDWWAVATGRRPVEIVAKPLTLIALVGVAALAEAPTSTAQALLILGLALSLAGDVFLLGDSSATFVSGLAAFLAGHIAYVAMFIHLGVTPALSMAGVVLAGTALGTLGRRILRGVSDSEPSMRLPVIAYMAVISLMLVAAIGNGRWLGVFGALLFYASDAAIAWTRFVHDHPKGRLFVIVTYHVAQAGIVAAVVA